MKSYIHFDYSKRYPESFARFTPQDLPRRLGGKKDDIICSYLNSIYFTDHVFSEIVKHYQGSPTLIIYLSDHGEILYDDPKDPEFFGHSPYSITKSAVSIPLMFYLSPELQSLYPHLRQMFVDAKGKRLSTDLMTHALTSFLGIQTRYSDPKLNFLSPSYDESRKRMVTATEGGSFVYEDPQ